MAAQSMIDTLPRRAYLGPVAVQSTGPAPHPDTQMWCSMLERLWIGNAAAAMLEAGDLPCGPSGVVLAPMWAWVIPEVPVGKKTETATGERRLLPVRASWSVSPIVLLGQSETVEVRYSCNGLGVAWDGAVVLEAFGGGQFPAVVPDPALFPQRVAVSVRTPDDVVELLTTLAEDGKAARWEAFQFIEPMLNFQVTLAHRSFSHEIQPGGGALLSEQSIQAVLNAILLGDPGTVDSFAFETIRRSIEAADLFVNVDPLHWLKTVVRREAQEALRTRLGDPHVGSRVRAVARELNTSDTAEVMAAYRQKHRSDRPGKDRTQAALSIAGDPMVRPVAVEDVAGIGVQQ